MKYTFSIKNIDCPNCAAKIERKIQGLKGVSEANLNFITETLIVEADETVSLKDLQAQIMKQARKVESECELKAL